MLFLNPLAPCHAFSCINFVMPAHGNWDPSPLPHVIIYGRPQIFMLVFRVNTGRLFISVFDFKNFDTEDHYDNNGFASLFILSPMEVISCHINKHPRCHILNFSSQPCMHMLNLRKCHIPLWKSMAKGLTININTICCIERKPTSIRVRKNIHLIISDYHVVVPY